MTWDRVLTIHDYHDGPILGVAEVQGVPHIYELEFDHIADEYADTYLVSPIDPDILALVIEDWDIWLRWHDAFNRQEVSIETQPALPADNERHEAIKLAMAGRLQADREQAKRLRAEFRNLRSYGPCGGTEVLWSYYEG